MNNFLNIIDVKNFLLSKKIANGLQQSTKYDLQLPAAIGQKSKRVTKKHVFPKLYIGI